VNIGRNIPAARLLTDLTMLLRQLIKRIEEKAQSEHPAADRVLGFRPPTGAPVEFRARNEKLNKEQRDAVASALGRGSTFIWGPPGTGKTQTIGEIGAQLFLRGRTLLMVSHTNTAVDEALIRIADALKSS
jgi:MoxR-like ATPase